LDGLLREDGIMPQTGPVRVVPRGLIQLWRWRVALLVGLVLSVGVSVEAQAATTWTVCASGCDYASIKSAIAAPTTLNGDTLAIAAGTYTELNIVVDKSLTLQGEGPGKTVVQAAATPNAATDRVFMIPVGVTVTLAHLTIRHGKAGGNGGGLINYGTLTLSHSTVRQNVASSYGGGLANWSGGTVTLQDSTVKGNTAGGSGGGLINYGEAMLWHSTVYNNHAGYQGGGLGNGGTLRLRHSTLSGNTVVDGYGGGLANWSGGTVTLQDSTVSGNTAPCQYCYGGGLFNGGSLTLLNSILAGNAATGGDPDCHVYMPLTSDGYNLLGAGTGCPSDGPDDRTVSPALVFTKVLGPLQDNGGATWTHAPLPGSPAMDAIPWGINGCGTTFTSDQRWRARPQPAGGNCDIGAYEVAVAGQALGGWVTGLTLHTVTCKNVTTGQVVTLSDPSSPWDCEAAGLLVTSEDQVVLRARGPVKQGATDVGAAVVGMVLSSGGCTNLTTGQQVQFQHMQGATAASCVAVGLVVQPGNRVQISVQGVAE
jgi:hypothetical protein